MLTGISLVCKEHQQAQQQQQEQQEAGGGAGVVYNLTFDITAATWHTGSPFHPHSPTCYFEGTFQSASAALHPPPPGHQRLLQCSTVLVEGNFKPRR